jgi:hypothetical protein
MTLNITSHLDSRFFAFIGCGLLTCSFRGLDFLVCLAAGRDRIIIIIIVVVVVVISSLVGLGEMGVAFVERPSADDLIVLLTALDVGFLSFAEFIYVH